jgi:hypothetical protein
LLNEIVVVVGESKYFFKGKDLKVINKIIYESSQFVLIIMDGNKDIAVFQKWDLWKKVEED